MKTNNCKQCEGLGRIEEKIRNLATLDWVLRWVPCPICDGTGRKWTEEESTERNQRLYGTLTTKKEKI